MALITLTTDFGDSSPYAAVMKGVILSINPAAQIVDLSHQIRPQDLRHACYFLGTAVPYFPAGTIHLCVIDPGVGSERAAICAAVGGQMLIGPDNGILTGVFDRCGAPESVRSLAEPRFWRQPVSDTFHGRDIFAPIAAHLSLGLDPCQLGPEHPNPATLPSRPAVIHGDRCRGEVQFVDDFGNVITNIPAENVKSLPVKVSFYGEPLHAIRWVRTYGEAVPGELVCLFSSDGFFEIAQVGGHAARRLNVREGAEVDIAFE